MSAVDQGYRYAINLPCDWIIVTSMRQTRLYYKGSDQYTYERFDTDALAKDEAQLKRFVFLLGAERVVPAAGPVPSLRAAQRLGEGRPRADQGVLRPLRRHARGRLRAPLPGEPGRRPARGAGQHAEAARPHPVLLPSARTGASCPPRPSRKPTSTATPTTRGRSGRISAACSGPINIGNTALNIPAYNGGLFADDPELDRLTVPDEVCRYFQDLAAYDYRPAARGGRRRRPTGAKLVDVDILGHIFEQSITDLERLRNELDGLTERLGRAEHASRRKKEGAFYTPAFITRYIVGQALGSVLRRPLRGPPPPARRGGRGHRPPRARRPARLRPGRPRTRPSGRPSSASGIPGRTSWRRVKLLDPSCGSGAFLIEAFEQLYTAYQQSNDRLEELRGHAHALRPRPADPAEQPLRRGPQRRGHRDLPA